MGKDRKKKPLSLSPPGPKAFSKFYKTDRGRFLKNEIHKSLGVSWTRKTITGKHFLGVGYPPPGLKGTLKKASSFAVFFPAFMSPEAVKMKGFNISAQVDEARLPLRPGSYDAVFVFHALEYMDDPVSFLEEVWKSLSPGGKLTVMVPNRRAGWRKSGIPGQNQIKPFLFREVKTLLENAGFKINHSYGIFYGLPVGFLKTLLFSKLLKTISGGSFAGLPGFMIFESEKTTGPAKVEFSEPLKKAPGVKAFPGILPE